MSPVAIAETSVQASDTAVKSAATERPKTAAAKSAAVEPTAVQSAKSTAVETASAPARCVGETWLAENGRAQQRSCNARHRPPLPGPCSAIA
jgi:hypothetical protein